MLAHTHISWNIRRREDTSAFTQYMKTHTHTHWNTVLLLSFCTSLNMDHVDWQLQTLSFKYVCVNKVKNGDLFNPNSHFQGDGGKLQETTRGNVLSVTVAILSPLLWRHCAVPADFGDIWNLNEMYFRDILPKWVEEIHVQCCTMQGLYVRIHATA